MADTPSITLVKRFTYRGVPEETSNTYHFSGTTPGSLGAWKTLADALIAKEKTVHHAGFQYTRAYGYEAGNEHSVATVDYVALGGTLVTGTGTTDTKANTAGDAAMVLRALRDGRSAKGRAVYCIKYFHGPYVSSTDPDRIETNQAAKVTALGASLLDGSLPGGFKWCAPQGQSLSNPLCSPFVTTRTLKRRGKRPH